MSKAKKLDLEKLRAAWTSEKTRSQIQLEFDISPETLRVIAQKNNWPPKRMASKKARVAVGRLREAWLSKMSRKQICIQFNISESMLSTLAKEQKWPAKEKSRGRPTGPEYEPTEEEIRQATAEIRRGWDEKETSKRAVGPRRIEWSAHEYSYDRMSTAFDGIN